MALAASGLRRISLAAGSKSMNDLRRTFYLTMPHIWLLDISDHWSYISPIARTVKSYFCCLADAALATPTLSAALRRPYSIDIRHPLYLTLRLRHSIGYMHIPARQPFLWWQFGSFLGRVPTSLPGQTPLPACASPALHPWLISR
jgi:hypothetical protein